MEGVKVNGILTLFRGKVSFWMYRDVWMVALIGKEWRDTCGSIQSIVVQELCKWQELRPVVLLIVTINPKVLL